MLTKDCSILQRVCAAEERYEFVAKDARLRQERDDANTRFESLNAEYEAMVCS